MKFAFSRPTRSDADRAALFATFGPAGYAGLQLKSNQYADYLDDPARFVAEWGQYPGVAATVIHGGKLDAAGTETLRRVLRFGQAAGSDLVVFWPQDARDGSVDLTDFSQRMSALGQEAQAAGLRLSLHHHHNQIVMTRDELETFFSAITPGTVGLTVDTAHLVKSGIPDVAGVIRDFASVIDNFHLKDYENGAWRVLGRGIMDFAPIFAAIREIGYDGWVAADEESGAALDDGLAASMAVLSAELG